MKNNFKYTGKKRRLRQDETHLCRNTFGLNIDDMPEFPNKIQSSTGNLIDVSGPRWKVFGTVGDLRVGDLPFKNLRIRRATELFLIDRLKRLSAQTVEGNVNSLLKLSLSSSFVSADSMGAIIPSVIVREVGEELKRNGYVGYRRVQATVRLWYTWCADMGFPHFDPDVANELELLTIGADPRGVAVLSSDPNKGPLSNADFNALCNQLKNFKYDQLSAATLFSYCLVWLCIALGCNVKNIAYLCEEDLKVFEDKESDERLYILHVPRIKKPGKYFRDEFKARKIHPFIGRMLEQLISENKSRRLNSLEWKRFGKGALYPLFMRDKPNYKWLHSDAQPFAWFHESGSLRHLMLKFVDQLSIPTASVAEETIRVYPRRLRYTFATRLVKEGASPQVVAEALDHTDLQHVMVYFNVRNDIVNFLDRANPKLVAVAQMFTGLLVEDESQAERGNDPTSRIYLPPGTRSFEPIGNCGSMGFCSQAAPIACYTCRFFRPWRDAPHHKVFDFLADLRQRKIEAGADIKNIQIHDCTLMAVAHVIKLCEGGA